MRIRERVVGNVTILEIKGNLMGGDETETFHQKLESLRQDKINQVVLDLGGVALISSAGVGMLISGAKSIRASDGDLRLANLTERVHNVLVVITQLGAVFKIYETADRAADSYDSE